MESHRLKKIDSYVLIWGIALCFFATFFRNQPIFFGVFVGAFIAFFNWVGLRYLMERVISTDNKQARYGILLAIKAFFVLGVIALIVLFVPIEMLAFLIGLSSLVLGIFTHSIRYALLGGETALKEDL